MPDWDYAVALTVLLFVLTAGLLIAVLRIGRTSLGRLLALGSIVSVCGANYAMLMAYKGEPEIVYERPGPIERRVIQRRGQFEYVDKEDAGGGGGSGGGGDAAAHANAGQPSGGAADGTGGSGSGGGGGAGSPSSSGGTPARSSPLASLISNLSDTASAVQSDTQEYSLGDRLNECADCPDLVVVAPGYFRMGAVPGDIDALPDERPRRLLSMRRWYAIGRIEVTLAQYLAFARATGHAEPKCGNAPTPSNLAAPVTCVSLADTLAYVGWLKTTTGHSYRLATESEWEWAARRGIDKRYVGGDVAPVVRPVTNAIGMGGIHGGVAERVATCWQRSDVSRRRDARCPSTVVRDTATGEVVELARLSARRAMQREERSPHVGFRVVRDL